MTQTSLDDDELFTEAATEMRSDVESSLEEARQALPAADDLWEIEADNTLGVLNGLRTALELDDASEHLREAKKWYAMGTEADAFEDAEDLSTEIETVETLLADVETAHEQVSELASTIPQLKSSLEDAADEPDADADPAPAEA